MVIVGDPFYTESKTIAWLRKGMLNFVTKSNFMSLEDLLKKNEVPNPRENIVSEWQNEVQKVEETIRGWFSNLERQKLLIVSHHSVDKHEEFLGNYSIQNMVFDFHNFREIVFEPLARMIFGGMGRIDIYRKGYNSDLHYLIRELEQDGSTKWILISSANVFDRKPFDKGVLEELFIKWLG